MSVENGEWIMHGLAWDDPDRIKSVEELEEAVERLGFLPLFAGDIAGFSVEEMTSPKYWWSGALEHDPWEWRELVAGRHRVAYGKFFDGKAGFISLQWLPRFVNYRRGGYDFDARWDDGRASRREKKIMDFFIGVERDGSLTFSQENILSTDLKKKAGFGKGGEKNYSGIMSGLQSQMYLVTSDFKHRKNKKGETYGMAVSIPLPPESLWGYDAVTSAYTEEPQESAARIREHILELFPEAGEKAINVIIGKMG